MPCPHRSPGLDVSGTLPEGTERRGLLHPGSRAPLRVRVAGPSNREAEGRWGGKALQQFQFSARAAPAAAAERRSAWAAAEAGFTSGSRAATGRRRVGGAETNRGCGQVRAAPKAVAGAAAASADLESPSFLAGGNFSSPSLGGLHREDGCSPSTAFKGHSVAAHVPIPTASTKGQAAATRL